MKIISGTAHRALAERIAENLGQPLADVHVSALRKKLGDDAKSPRFIRTVRAAGYMLCDPTTPL